MAEMQNVETAVRDDEFFPAGAKLLSPIRQFFKRDDFVTEIHGVILPAPGRMATIYHSKKIYFLAQTR
jgi:hypothetical protein